MSASKPTTRPSFVDPDDAPELTREWFEGADLYEGDRLIRRGRGRPKLARPKEAISIRLSPDVLEYFRSGGAGWQTRIDETLRESVRRARRKASGSP